MDYISKAEFFDLRSRPASAPVLYHWDEQRDEEVEIELPTCWAVCPCCHGEGKTVNPSIDGNGISTRVFAEDPEFAEQYFSGALDVSCGHCEGKRVVREVNWGAMPEWQVKAYEKQLDDEHYSMMEQYAEMRMGA